MTGFELIFDHPARLWLIPVALLFSFLPLLRLSAGRRRKAKHYLPAIFTSLSLTLLTLLFAGFSVVHQTSEKAVLLLVDRSDSMKSVEEEVEAMTGTLQTLIDEKTPCGVLVFGNDAVYSMPLKAGVGSLTRLDEVDGVGTDMAAALTMAESLFPKDRAGQVILLTDGLQTDGDAQAVARRLAEEGIRVDGMYFDTTKEDSKEVLISSFFAPESAWKEEAITLSCEIISGVKTQARVRLFEGEDLIRNDSVLLTPGTKVLDFTVTPKRSGSLSYRVQILPEIDTREENNTMYTHTRVTGNPSILILADKEKNVDYLKDILSQEGIVTVKEAKNAPKTLAELCDFDQVILANVDLMDLPKKFENNLDTFARVFGKSVLFAGGRDTFMYGNMENTLMEEMMPVSFNYEKSFEGQSVSLMLVLDTSRSMAKETDYLSVAKQGAIRCVEAMTENDSVGLVTFNSYAQVQSPLIRANQRNKDEICRTISSLTTDLRTFYTQALTLAVEELEKSQDPIRHIIFLSDGQPSDDGYYQVVKSAARKGISVSTIGLGFSSEILENISKIGSGRYYYVKSAQDTPDIMLSETKKIAVSSLVEEEITPVVNKDSDVTDFLDGAALPQIQGYLGTTPKEDGDVFISTPKGDPIFASWNWGAGKVGVFTSDLSAHWTERWFDVSLGTHLITNFSSHLTPASSHKASFSAAITPGSRAAKVEVRVPDQVKGSLSLHVTHGGGEEETKLEQTATGSYVTTFSTPQVGLYEVVIVQTDEKGQVVDFLETSLSVSYSQEYNAFRTGGDKFLEKITSDSTSLSQDPKALAEAKVSPIDLVWDPIGLFVPLILFLFLSGLAIRLLRKKDLEAVFQRLKRKK